MKMFLNKNQRKTKSEDLNEMRKIKAIKIRRKKNQKNSYKC